MVTDPTHVWLLAQDETGRLLQHALTQRGLSVVHVDAAGETSAQPPACAVCPDALVYFAPRPDPACRGSAIVKFTSHAVATLVASTQMAVRRMATERRPGAIVIVTDIAGIPGRAQHAAAATLSGALIGAAKCLAKELGRQDISVNVVAFGIVPELGIDSDLRPAERKLFEMMNLGKPARLEHLVENIAHLIGRRHLMTGQVLHVDDGLII